LVECATWDGSNSTWGGQGVAFGTVSIWCRCTGECVGDGLFLAGRVVKGILFSKAFRVYNIRTRRVEENLHIEFLENKPIVAGAGPKWLFDIDMLTKSMNYVSVIAGTNSDDFAGTKDSIGAGQSNMETRSTQDYIFMLLWKDGSPLFDSSPKISRDAGKKLDEMPGLETIATYDDSEEEVDFTNLESSIHVSPTPTTKTHKNHPLKQVIRSLNTPVQTRSKLKPTNEQENKKDERGIMIKNKERLVAHGHTQEEGIDYDEVFTPIVRIEAIRLFLAYASFMGFMVLSKINFSDVKSANTPVDTGKTLVKDADGDDVDVHLYRSMIGSLMYLTASRPDIIDSLFELVAYTDSDYVGASLDRKSTTRGCQFLGSRLISWQCKKQTMVATSTAEAEYVAAASCYG
nr:hypothetical protein [Tanacetum cinerariifolium]